jgi:deazaflavin-dependent oxidoreductase (nitroreductase family)
VPLPRALARFNRHTLNKVLGPLTYVTHPFAIVVHRGRNSGRQYRTPVWAFRTGEDFVIALTYGGSSTEWVQNVLANGSAVLIRREGSHEVSEPRLVHGDEGLHAMPAFTHLGLRVLSVDDYLVVTRQSPPSDGSSHNNAR